ncbi:hypothetical protein B0H21DRAFT_694117, partial [Amylocystis lapponica]
LPSIFEQRALEQLEDLRWEAQLRTLQGGEALLSRNSKAAPSALSLSPPTIAYAVMDPGRDTAAIELLGHRQISTPIFHESRHTFEIQCLSSLATEYDRAPTSYTISLCMDGATTCTCLDFQNRGGSCKHIRAALLQLEVLRKQGVRIPDIPLPLSAHDTRLLELARKLEDPLAGAMSLLQLQGPMQQAAGLVEDVLREAAKDVYHSADILDQPASEKLQDDPDSDDTQSVATDADDEFNFTALRGSSRRAVNNQSIARALHELDSAAPKLQQLGEYLAEAVLPSSEVARARSAKEDLDVLTMQLARMLASAASIPDTVVATLNNGTSHQSGLSNPNASVRPSTPPAHRKKRPVANIIAPLPEKSQKHKTSYGIH